MNTIFLELNNIRSNTEYNTLLFHNDLHPEIKLWYTWVICYRGIKSGIING